LFLEIWITFVHDIREKKWSRSRCSKSVWGQISFKVNHPRKVLFLGSIHLSTRISWNQVPKFDNPSGLSNKSRSHQPMSFWNGIVNHPTCLNDLWNVRNYNPELFKFTVHVPCFDSSIWNHLSFTLPFIVFSIQILYSWPFLRIHWPSSIAHLRRGLCQRRKVDENCDDC
jgi:hypothetical protein